MARAVAEPLLVEPVAAPAGDALPALDEAALAAAVVVADPLVDAVPLAVEVDVIADVLAAEEVEAGAVVAVAAEEDGDATLVLDAALALDDTLALEAALVVAAALPLDAVAPPLLPHAAKANTVSSDTRRKHRSNMPAPLRKQPIADVRGMQDGRRRGRGEGASSSPGNLTPARSWPGDRQ